MTRTEATDLLRRLGPMFPGLNLGPETVALWAVELVEFDVSDLSIALRSLSRDSKFLPALAEIIAECEIARAARLRQVRELEQAEASVEAVRAHLAGGCPEGIGAVPLPREWAPGDPGPDGQLVLDSLVVCGMLWGRVRMVGGEALPAAILDTERAPWSEMARSRWASRVMSELGRLEAEVHEKRARLALKQPPKKALPR